MHFSENFPNFDIRLYFFNEHHFNSAVIPHKYFNKRPKIGYDIVRNKTERKQFIKSNNRTWIYHETTAGVFFLSVDTNISKNDIEKSSIWYFSIYVLYAHIDDGHC